MVVKSGLLVIKSGVAEWWSKVAEWWSAVACLVLTGHSVECMHDMR